MQSLLLLSGLRWPVPDFSTLSRRQHHLDVQVTYQPSQGGLHLQLDSTGIKFLGEGEWKCKKHGAKHRRQWRKLHIGMDAQMLQVRAICVTSNQVSDAAVVPELLPQMPADELLLSVTGDGAYDSQRFIQRSLNATPYSLFHSEKMPECAKAMLLCIAMQQ